MTVLIKSKQTHSSLNRLARAWLRMHVAPQTKHLSNIITNTFKIKCSLRHLLHANIRVRIIIILLAKKGVRGTRKSPAKKEKEKCVTKALKCTFMF